MAPALNGITLPAPRCRARRSRARCCSPALQSEGTTTVVKSRRRRETTPSWRCAPLARPFMSAATRSKLAGGQTLHGGEFVVPGDISSAAFWAAAAAAIPGSDVEIHNVGLNPTRTALLGVLAPRRRDRGRSSRARGGRRAVGARSCSVWPASFVNLGSGPKSQYLIDEIPALAAWAAHGGELHVTGPGAAREGERPYQRARARISGARRRCRGVQRRISPARIADACEGGHADAAGDHRLAMAFAIAALGAETPSVISGADSVAISYPDFFATLEALCDER